MWKIPLFKMYWDEDDVKNVSDVIQSGMNWAAGPQTSLFEKKIAEYTDSSYAIVFNSGTSALHADLLAWGIGKGDEVIVPSFTFIATANAPRFVNAKPVFADIEPDTLGLDPDAILNRITKKTRAIILVHYGGSPCRIREIRKIADDHDLILIEDAAESFGAGIDGKKVGTFGDSAMFSFCQNKIITTGEGGAIVTGSKEHYEKLKLIQSHGRLETTDYFASTAVGDYITLGYNFRMSTLTAALGLSQIGKVDALIAERREKAAYYKEQLRDISQCRFFREPAGYFQVYQLFSLLADRRDDLMKHLERAGIMTKIYFSPVHKTEYYGKVLKYKTHLPVTESISRQIISLPFYPGISRHDMDTVVDEIRTFYG